jgi:hypothetical protein
MKCRFLDEEKNNLCTETGAAYMPSPFELEEYCRTGRYRVCPFYQIGDRRAGRLGEHEGESGK